LENWRGHSKLVAIPQNVDRFFMVALLLLEFLFLFPDYLPTLLRKYFIHSMACILFSLIVFCHSLVYRKPNDYLFLPEAKAREDTIQLLTTRFRKMLEKAYLRTD